MIKAVKKNSYGRKIHLYILTKAAEVEVGTWAALY